MTQIDPNTETSIANQALSAIKEASILSLDADDSQKAKVLRTHFAVTRDSLQRLYLWNFNEEYLLLPAGGTAPSFRFCKRFPLPVNPYILRVRQVRGLRRRHWKVQGRSIICNADAPLQVVASIRVTEVARFDELFKTTFIAALAYAIAPEISKDDDTIDRARKAAAEALARATPVDASEGAPDDPEEQDIILERY